MNSYFIYAYRPSSFLTAEITQTILGILLSSRNLKLGKFKKDILATCDQQKMVCGVQKYSKCIFKLWLLVS